MIHRSSLALLAVSSVLAFGSALQAASNRTDALQMVSIDVEGGGGILFCPHPKVIPCSLTLAIRKR